jgi:hypothetical protein
MASIPAQNIKVLFIGAICAVLWGGYTLSNAVYYSVNWTETQGTVVDFERHVMTCGKGVSECYSLLVGYHAGDEYYVTDSVKKFSRNQSRHLLDQKVVVYYSPDNNAEAILVGEYGPYRYGLIIFLIGAVVLFLFWMFRKRK